MENYFAKRMADTSSRDRIRFINEMNKQGISSDVAIAQWKAVTEKRFWDVSDTTLVTLERLGIRVTT